MPSRNQGRNPAPTIAQIVGRNLRLARETAQLTQRELAQRVGGKTDGQRISDWERGVNRPGDEALFILASLLQRDYAWFFTDHSDEQVAA